MTMFQKCEGSRRRRLNTPYILVLQDMKYSGMRKQAKKDSQESIHIDRHVNRKTRRV